MKKKSKIVLTGAAGKLGSRLRAPLSAMAETLVSTDIAELQGDLLPNERYEQADLGAYNVWEAAHRLGVKRVVYASSMHAVGMYSKTQTLTVDLAHRPDTFYGLSKCFAEDLARLYWEKRGVEAVCLRIYSCSPVTNTRSLGTWLSYGDLAHLVERAVDTPIVEFSIIYGVSNNDRAAVDNSGASFLGYRPKDNAEQFAEKILSEAPDADPLDPGQARHGGPFASVPLGESGIAHLNIAADEN